MQMKQIQVRKAPWPEVVIVGQQETLGIFPYFLLSFTRQTKFLAIPESQ